MATNAVAVRCRRGPAARHIFFLLTRHRFGRAEGYCGDRPLGVVLVLRGPTAHALRGDDGVLVVWVGPPGSWGSRQGARGEGVLRGLRRLRGDFGWFSSGALRRGSRGAGRVCGCAGRMCSLPAPNRSPWTPHALLRNGAGPFSTSRDPDFGVLGHQKDKKCDFLNVL